MATPMQCGSCGAYNSLAACRRGVCEACNASLDELQIEPFKCIVCHKACAFIMCDACKQVMYGERMPAPTQAQSGITASVRVVTSDTGEIRHESDAHEELDRLVAAKALIALEKMGPAKISRKYELQNLDNREAVLQLRVTLTAVDTTMKMEPAGEQLAILKQAVRDYVASLGDSDGQVQFDRMVELVGEKPARSEFRYEVDPKDLRDMTADTLRKLMNTYSWGSNSSVSVY